MIHGGLRCTTNRAGADRTSITLRLEPNESIRKLWPHDFVARYTVTVGATLVPALPRDGGSALQMLHESLPEYAMQSERD